MYYGKCRLSTCAAASPSITTEQDAGGGGGGWKLGLWTALDVTATLGSVGGAVAFVLTQEVMLVGLPIVLPLLALYASRQREAAALEVRPARRPRSHLHWVTTSRWTTCNGLLNIAPITLCSRDRRVGQQPS